MANRVCIPDWEYQERIKKAAKMLQEKGIAVTKDGCESMTDYLKKGIIEIDG